jgi:hypothetical protein
MAQMLAAAMPSEPSKAETGGAGGMLQHRLIHDLLKRLPDLEPTA